MAPMSPEAAIGPAAYPAYSITLIFVPEGG